MKSKIRSKTQKKKRKNIFKLLIFVFCFYCTWNIVSTQVKIKNQMIVLEQVKNKCDEQQRENDESISMIKLESDEQHIKRMARDRLGFVAQDERVFVDISSK